MWTNFCHCWQKSFVLTLIAPLAVSTPSVHSQVCTNPLTRTPSGNEKRFEFAEKNSSRQLKKKMVRVSGKKMVRVSGGLVLDFNYPVNN